MLIANGLTLKEKTSVINGSLSKTSNGRLDNIEMHAMTDVEQSRVSSRFAFSRPLNQSSTIQCDYTHLSCEDTYTETRTGGDKPEPLLHVLGVPALLLHQ